MNMRSAALLHPVRAILAAPPVRRTDPPRPAPVTF